LEREINRCSGGRDITEVPSADDEGSAAAAGNQEEPRTSALTTIKISAKITWC